MSKSCYCHTRRKHFNPLGIMRHRAMHRNKGENCEITYTNGDRIFHKFGNKQEEYNNDRVSEKS